MEVVRSNFEEKLPIISNSIEKADFLSIDAEFTGLINGRDVSIYDSPKEYYNLALNGSCEFLLIQFGLSAFYWDEEKKHYMNDSYNFYLYPRGRPGPDRMFLCQSSSLDFLASNGFNFNKLIKEGISYMTAITESKLRETLTERQQSYGKEKDIVRIPDENKQLIEEICQKVKNFIDNTTEDEMEIDRCNAFVRMLLFQELRLRFKDDVIVDTKVLENKNRVLRVIRKTDGNDQDAMRKKREWDELEEAVGFSKVAQMISQSQKLVVGHNMLLDILHTLGHFFQELPTDFTAFKEFTHCMFPKLLDTKYMSSLPPFKDLLESSVLQQLLSTLSEPPFSIPKVGSVEGCGYSHLDSKEHEAGYDAYITGLCFLAMHAHLLRMRGEGSVRLTPESPTLKPFLNKLFLAKTARHDSPYINLVGEEPTPSRDHVFHLEFPREWQRSDLNQLFSPFGAITVQFIDDTSAYIGLDRRDQAGDVMRALAMNSRVTLTPYHKYKSYGRGRDGEMAIRSERPKTDTYKLIRKTDQKPRQALSRSRLTMQWTSPQLPQPPQLPQKVSRVRSNSTSMTSPPPSSRKRSSSGVFQVDESEPLAKKSEVSPSPPETPQRPSGEERRLSAETTYGRKKTDTAESGKKEATASKKKYVQEKKKEKVEKINDKIDKERVIQKFDSKAKSNCVTAFKESEIWD